MKRVDLGENDSLTIVAVALAIEELGGETNFDGEPYLGVGLHRFRFPTGEVTVFVDAWSVDLAGPDELVDAILAAMADRR